VLNIGPFEFVVLAAVALIVFGPDKLPQLSKDAARMLRTLRDMAQGARSQLTNELGPEFANLDLASLNPRTAIQKALLGEDAKELAAMNPAEAIRSSLRDDAAERTGATEPVGTTPNLATPNLTTPNLTTPNLTKGPLGAGERPPFDPDTT
jgi:sec-independent protein translocase protein TatB